MFVDRDASWSIYAWICTTRLQPPHATYVAWKWLAYITHCHTSCLDIIVISIKTSRQSQNLQNWTNNLSADWKCMDNLILSCFFSLQFLVLALPDWNSTGTVRWYCVEACISLENSILGILWLLYVFWLQRSGNWYGDWFGTLTLRFSSFPFELCHVFAFGL